MRSEWLQVPEHPAGVGHLVNHPPAGVPPNVMPLSYDVPEALGALAARVPNRFLRPPSAMFVRESVLLRTIVLVTTQHVTDSELFLECVREEERRGQGEARARAGRGQGEGRAWAGRRKGKGQGEGRVGRQGQGGIGRVG